MSRTSVGFTRALIGGASIVALYMVTPSVAQAGCNVFAKDPYVTRIGSQLAIMGAGTRGTDCKEKKIFIVRLRHHKTLWFDETLAEIHFTVSNGTLRVKYLCRGPGVKTFFTEAWVQGEEKHKSNYKKFEACS